MLGTVAKHMWEESQGKTQQMLRKLGAAATSIADTSSVSALPKYTRCTSFIWWTGFWQHVDNIVINAISCPCNTHAAYQQDSKNRIKRNIAKKVRFASSHIRTACNPCFTTCCVTINPLFFPSKSCHLIFHSYPRLVILF